MRKGGGPGIAPPPPSRHFWSSRVFSILSWPPSQVPQLPHPIMKPQPPQVLCAVRAPCHSPTSCSRWFRISSPSSKFPAITATWREGVEAGWPGGPGSRERAGNVARSLARPKPSTPTMPPSVFFQLPLHGLSPCFPHCPLPYPLGVTVTLSLALETPAHPLQPQTWKGVCPLLFFTSLSAPRYRRILAQVSCG